MACNIPYIENSGLTPEKKAAKVIEHVNTINKVLANTEFNFTKRTFSKVFGTNKFNYINVPENQKAAVKNWIKKNGLGTIVSVREEKFNNVLVVNVLGSGVSNTLANSDFDLLAHHKEYLASLGTLEEDIENAQTIEQIVNDTDNLNVFYKILDEIKTVVNGVIEIEKPKNSNLGKNMSVIRNMMNNPEAVNRAGTAISFLKWAVKFTKDAKYKLRTSDNNIFDRINKLKDFTNNNDRRTEIKEISIELDKLKNKMMLFSTLEDIATQLSFSTRGSKDIFEIYNKYAILANIEKKLNLDYKIKKDKETIDKILQGLNKNIPTENDLIVEVTNISEELDLGFSNEEIEDILVASIFSDMINREGNLRKTLYEEISTARDTFKEVSIDTREALDSLNVEWLYHENLLNSHGVQNEKEEADNLKTAEQKYHSLTREKLKGLLSVSTVNNNFLEYVLKHASKLNDKLISTLSTTLKSIRMEIDLDTSKLDTIVEKFKKFTLDQQKSYSTKMTSYSFELDDVFDPSIIVSTGNSIIHTEYVYDENNNKIEVEREYELGSPTLYDNFYKVNSKTGEAPAMWVYKSKLNEIFYKVVETKSLKGKNKNNIYQLEHSLFKINKEKLYNELQTTGAVDVYGVRLIRNNKSDSINLQNIEKVFNDKFFNFKDSNYKIEVTNRILDFYNADFIDSEGKIFATEDFKEDIKGDYKTISLNAKTEKYVYNQLKSLVYNGNHKLLTFYGINGNFILVENKDKKLIAVSVRKSKGEVKLFDEIGNEVEKDSIRNFFIEGDNMQTIKEAELIKDLEFEAELGRDNNFKEFFDLYNEEYEKLEKDDEFAFFSKGNLPQVRDGFKNKFVEKVRGIWNSDNKKEEIVKAIGDYYGVKETTKHFYLTDNEGQFINEQGERVEIPILVQKSKYRNMSIDGLFVNDIRPDFTKRVYSQYLVEDDLVGSLIATNQQLAVYNKMKEVDLLLKHNMMINSGEGIGAKVLGIEKRKYRKHISSKDKKYQEFIEQNGKEAAKTIEHVLRVQGYGETKLPYEETTITKIVDALQGFSYFQILALSLKATTQNIFTGNINNFLAFVGDKHKLNVKDLIAGQKLATAAIYPILSGLQGTTNISDAHVYAKLANTFKAIGDVFYQGKDYKEDKNFSEHWFSYQSLFKGMAVGEVMIHIPLLLGVMKSYKLSEEYSVYDAVRVDGKPITEPEASMYGKLTFEDQNGKIIDVTKLTAFNRKLHTIISESQGDYTEWNVTRGKSDYWWSKATIFSHWLYPFIEKRFGKESFDVENGEFDLGGHQAIYLNHMLDSMDNYVKLLGFSPTQNWFQNSTKGVYNGFKNYKKLGKDLGKFIGSTALNMFNFNDFLFEKSPEQLQQLLRLNREEFGKKFGINQMTMESHGIEESSEEYKKRLDKVYLQYQDRIRTAANEMWTLVAITIFKIGLTALIKHQFPDDEDEKKVSYKILKWVEVITQGAVTDASLGAPLLAPFKGVDVFSQKLKDPLLILRSMNNVKNLIWQTVGVQAKTDLSGYNWLIDDEYSKNGPTYDKGDLIWNAKFRKVFGPYNQIARMFNPEQEERVIKSLNISSVFVDEDTDLIKKDTDYKYTGRKSRKKKEETEEE